jgi:hypothetical protein
MAQAVGAAKSHHAVPLRGFGSVEKIKNKQVAENVQTHHNGSPTGKGRQRSFPISN